ncbi:MAG: carbohydrate kinase, partial [Anaerolineae bacterium]|nr:carbohydrate kinase [Anaerolineae bacterium]
PYVGWSEADMAETWEMVVACVRDLLKRAGTASERIAAVGVTGNMVGAWLVDKTGTPVRRAILWNDNRTQSWIDEQLARRPDFMSRIFQSSGSVMQQGCTLPVLRWLATHEPESLDRARAVLCCKDWIVYRLTGTLQLDVTEAAVLPGSARERSYSMAMLEHIGIADHAHLLPQVVMPDTIVGTIQPGIADLMGLRAGTPVVAGVGDVPAVTIGIGAVEAGTACTILGTNILNGVVVDVPIFEPPDLGLLFTLPDNLWMRTMVNVAGTTNLDWFIANFCRDLREQSSGSIFEQLEALAIESGLGARGVLYLPYLSTQGIITPFVEPRARAEFYGVHNNHTRGDFVRAIYEGVAISIRDSFAVIPGQVETMRLAGGGARSPFWSQMIADCTGIEVQVPSGHEYGAKGVALLAGVAIGWYANLSEAMQTAVQISRIYQPDPARQVEYTALYAKYRALQKALPPVWHA